MGLQFGQGELVVGGERMAARDDHDAVLVEERPGVDIGVVDRKIDDGGVKSLAHELRKERRGRGLDDHHLDEGVGPLQCVEQWRDEPPGGRADDPESDMAADLIAERCQIMFDRSEFADDAAGPIGDDLPLGGEFARARSIRVEPSSVSSRAIWVETLDCTVCRARAAAENERCSATAERVQLAKVHRCE